MSSAPHIPNASTHSDLADWGVQPNALDGASHSSGRLLYKGPNNQPESGIWVCTPGRWTLSIPRDELCYFMFASTKGNEILRNSISRFLKCSQMESFWKKIFAYVSRTYPGFVDTGLIEKCIATYVRSSCAQRIKIP